MLRTLCVDDKDYIAYSQMVRESHPDKGAGMFDQIVSVHAIDNPNLMRSHSQFQSLGRQNVAVYHGTTWDAACSIVIDGFVLDKSGRIYASRDATMPVEFAMMRTTSARASTSDCAVVVCQTLDDRRWRGIAGCVVRFLRRWRCVDHGLIHVDDKYPLGAACFVENSSHIVPTHIVRFKKQLDWSY